jgi:gluconolactonase
LDDILPSDASLRRLAGGFKWAEGPLWLPREETLLFSDIPANTIYQWDQGRGVTVYRKPSSGANGNTLDLKGRLITCEHESRRVSRTEADGQVVTLASHYDNKRFNSPNDVVVRSDGSVYFTDPLYGLVHSGTLGQRELDCQGVYRISPKNKAVTLEVDYFKTPNGLAFSPDEQYLYVNDSDLMLIRVFNVGADGSLTNGRTYAELDPKWGPGGPDGMKTDREGNIYTTGPSGIWIFDSTANLVGILTMPESTTNMNWGGVDRRELFITTATGSRGSCLYQLELAIPGHF